MANQAMLVPSARGTRPPPPWEDQAAPLRAAVAMDLARVATQLRSRMSGLFDSDPNEEADAAFQARVMDAISAAEDAAWEAAQTYAGYASPTDKLPPVVHGEEVANG